jgi:photosystem II stability/assembly factor-like uncharacterized protein
MIRLAVWLSLLVGATLASLGQPAPGQFEPPGPVAGLRWWLTPLEEDSALRPAVSSNILNGVFFLPGQAQLGWAVGVRGAILHTENGGATWQPQASGVSVGLTSVAFATPQEGWAVGFSGTILHTENAGATWQRQSSDVTDKLTSVAFATPQSGWVVSFLGTILHTEDGGATWQPQSS